MLHQLNLLWYESDFALKDSIYAKYQITNLQYQFLLMGSFLFSALEFTCLSHSEGSVVIFYLWLLIHIEKS